MFAQRGDDNVSLGDAADYGEGGPGADLVHGDAGDDDVVGGSFTPATGAQPTATGQPDGGDTLAGDAGQDVVLGDNGSLTRPDRRGADGLLIAATSPLTLNRVTAQRAIAPYDLGDSSVAGTSGADTITGDADNDVLLGQGGNDQRGRRLRGRLRRGRPGLRPGAAAVPRTTTSSAARPRAARRTPRARSVSPTAPTTSTAAAGPT